MKKTVTVGASSYTGNYLLPRILPDWEKASPDTELVLEISDSEKVFSQVENGELQVGLIGACLESYKVSAEQLLPNDELVLIVPRNHALAEMSTVSIEDLHGSDFVMREPGSATRMWYRETFGRLGLGFGDLNVVAELDSHPAIIAAVASGSGISMVPRQAAADAIEAGHVRLVEVRELSPMTGGLYFIWPRGDSIAPETRDFITFLESEKPRLSEATHHGPGGAEQPPSPHH